MGECTVTWGLAGDHDSFEVARGSGSSISSTELLKDIRQRVAASSSYVAVVRDVEGKQVDEDLQIPGGTHLTVQRITADTASTVKRYMTLDSLFEAPPREVEPPQSMEVDQAAPADGSAQAAPAQPPAPDMSLVPSDLLCPVTKRLLTDAVTLTCCMNTISKTCYRPGEPCPMCRATTSIAPPDKRIRRLAQKYLPVQ
eukprot:TRINITY_DN68241_c0_g1_i1.p1 TRINITY_DN68241_c0_g1~~TRINITY_DN68241_c0_g1_i1.p1  ORF type:complete len:208 (+),score=72.84 TRINITY_DN68241_c0_g1_i1:33-626(+)